MPIMDDIVITAPRADDYPDWRKLFEGYATFYKTAMNDETAKRVWGWLLDPAYPFEALVARNEKGRVVGLAHFRAVPRSLSGRTGGFLDDLFVDPDFRGHRVADRLIEAMAALGRERGWMLIRWRTADNNYRARGVYDRLATRTGWLTYQLDL